MATHENTSDNSIRQKTDLHWLHPVLPQSLIAHLPYRWQMRGEHMEGEREADQPATCFGLQVKITSRLFFFYNTHQMKWFQKIVNKGTLANNQ